MPKRNPRSIEIANPRPIAKDTIGGNLRITLVDPSTDATVTLTFTSRKEFLTSAGELLHQLKSGHDMMSELRIWKKEEA